ncbi:four-carbon acid sugar kinase family protein [Clostridium sp. DJ247]|uniref:four-carbon acid sugar kinase family protein n=1 Tax=Clostridium sp. DJ247 TaxID=2726188 RepID=UPI0016288B3E|nr:four-carbon acid sugar kinase family protein [Clostridium sp. DJ247]MBC2580515.1 four-carbon acid sugar kinase family protein [Clostridium sp. DJ247]
MHKGKLKLQPNIKHNWREKLKMQHLIIADDFTGANDTGVQFRKRGIKTDVIFEPTLIDSSGEAFVIDTESRGLTEKEAYDKVMDISSNALNIDFDYVYKKVDSTLRGNIIAEIKAINENYKPDIIVFAPAYPDNNRTTVNGIQKMNGIPITETEIAKDPKKPVKEDNIANFLRSGLKEEVVHVYISDIRTGNIDLSKGKIFTFDAELNKDLLKIVEAVIDTKKKVLWVGAAGLADAILQTTTNSKPVLSIVGSISNVSREQVGFAEAKGAYVIDAHIELLLQNNNEEDLINDAIDKLKSGRDVIVISSLRREDYEACIQIGESMGMSKEDISIYTQRKLASITEKILKEVEVSGVFATGGDTAIEIISKLNSKGSSIIQEISPGIPLMKLKGGTYHGLRVITKAGAFGKDDSLEYSIKKLKEAL